MESHTRTYTQSMNSDTLFYWETKSLAKLRSPSRVECRRRKVRETLKMLCAHFYKHVKSSEAHKLRYPGTSCQPMPSNTPATVRQSQPRESRSHFQMSHSNILDFSDLKKNVFPPKGNTKAVFQLYEMQLKSASLGDAIEMHLNLCS